MPDNLDAFNSNLRAGKPMEQAALDTFTGTQARNVLPPQN
jgi:hypothetical protein